MTIKMKNVVAKGNTQRATLGSRISPNKPSQLSISVSITFCPPVGTSFTRHVVTRTMTRITAATIHVQIIELVTGNPKTVNTAGAAGGTPSGACPASAGAAV